MEDVLSVYARSYDESFPVICMVEKPVQLFANTRKSRRSKDGRIEYEDNEYIRNGTAAIFLFSEPLNGWRFADAQEHRTREDWAKQIKWLLDEQYPNATKRYKNIEIPAEIKRLEYCGFRFDVPEDGGAITFKIWFNEGTLPEIWPAERERQHRVAKSEPVAMMEQRYGVTGADRKTLVAVISTITGIDARYLGMPSQGYQIGDYLVDREGTLTGPESPALIAELAAKGFEAK